ncbi:GDP-mannose 4,6-dehydratase [Litorivicinus sp.]|nr:GDP-mannose 4,6-dehydratase [Litorivicinus sp.]
MDNATWVVLGGGGSFGIHASKYILENANPKKVVGIGRNLLRSPAFSLGIDEQPNYEYRAYHVTYEFDLLMKFLDELQPDFIVNFAAQGEGAVSWENSWRFFETNSMALARLAEALTTRSYLKRFIQIGTSEMYGSVTEPSKETDCIMPSSPYAASKVAFDMYLESIFRFKGFPMNIIRPSNAYCSGQLLHRVIPKTIVAGLTGRKLPLQGGGKAEKSYIHARDLGKAILLVAQSAPLGKIYNAGPEEPTSIRRVVELCAEVLDVPFDDICEVVPDRLGQDSRYWLDSSAIFEDVGWKPEMTWDVGLKEVKDWAEANLDVLQKTPTDYTLRG